MTTAVTATDKKSVSSCPSDDVTASLLCAKRQQGSSTHDAANVLLALPHSSPPASTPPNSPVATVRVAQAASTPPAPSKMLVGGSKDNLDERLSCPVFRVPYDGQERTTDTAAAIKTKHALSTNKSRKKPLSSTRQLERKEYTHLRVLCPNVECKFGKCKSDQCKPADKCTPISGYGSGTKYRRTYWCSNCGYKFSILATPVVTNGTPDYQPRCANFSLPHERACAIAKNNRARAIAKNNRGNKTHHGVSIMVD